MMRMAASDEVREWARVAACARGLGGGQLRCVGAPAAGGPASEEGAERRQVLEVSVKRRVADVQTDSASVLAATMYFHPSSSASAPSFFFPHAAEEVRFSDVSAEVLRVGSPSGAREIVVKKDKGDGAAGAAAGDSGAPDMGAEKQVIEVWERGVLRAKIATGDTCGAVLADGWFGGVSWSQDERFVVFVASKSTPKRQTPQQRLETETEEARKKLKQKQKQTQKRNQSKEEEDDADDEEQRNSDAKDKFAYREDWGERYGGKSNLGLFLLSLEHARVEQVRGVDPNATPGEPLLTEDGSHVIYTAWTNEPRRLGSIYCYHRPCSLMIGSLAETLAEFTLSPSEPGEGQSQPEHQRPQDPSPHVCLTAEMRLARTARLSPGQTKLVFLGSELGFDCHNGPLSLFEVTFQQPLTPASWMDAQQRSMREVIGLVQTPTLQPTEPDAYSFPGLYAGIAQPMLCSRPFLHAEDEELLLTTLWGSRISILHVRLADGGVRRIREACAILDDGGDGAAPAHCNDASAAVFDVLGSHVLFVASCVNRPQRLGVCAVPRFSPEARAEAYAVVGAPDFGPAMTTRLWVSDEELADVERRVRAIRWRVLHVQPSEDADALPFEAILVEPPRPASSSDSPPPLLVCPHGGPHSTTPTSFIHPYTYLCLQGYAILHVNFRGSLGFGATPLLSLPGNIGAQDVSDVYAATQRVLSLDDGRVVDAERVGVTGGSHGGFLSAHMIGQHPDVYKVTAMRNPVTNIPGMVTHSDIPDWCHVMSGTGYDFSTFAAPRAEDLARMYEVSPVRYADAVRAPCLMCIGAQDRRVPKSQGVEYYHHLKARGVPCKMRYYPEDVHSIDKPQSEADMWANVAMWFNEHLL